jgi:hypothetical protein
MGAEDLIACNLCDASDARAIVSMRKHVPGLFAFTAVQRCGSPESALESALQRSPTLNPGDKSLCWELPGRIGMPISSTDL